jgi:hypothetical protein
MLFKIKNIITTRNRKEVVRKSRYSELKTILINDVVQEQDRPLMNKKGLRLL